ncbi:MAG: RdgB/HAM1 family non-canonical purine NTP pyrophosphatase [Planctomycetota bacterium]|jgi:XTP/dITP diphosphohydrolase
MKRRILLASTNPGKLAELSELLGTVGEKIDWDCLSNYNARKKALGYAKATGLWTIADDSGLVIDALGGKPGVYSARYAADECPDSNRKAIDIANYKKVLAELKDTPDAKRTARFMCRICLATPEKVLLETEGTVEGVINHAPLGENGFGYDPIFLIPKLNKTAAQLDNQQKNRISHRGNAIRELKPLLDDLLKAD